MHLQAACMESDDVLPGLCALAQQWLQEVALPGFRSMPQHPVSLTDWYNDRKVSIYLQVTGLAPRLLDSVSATACTWHSTKARAGSAQEAFSIYLCRHSCGLQPAGGIGQISQQWSAAGFTRHPNCSHAAKDFHPAACARPAPCLVAAPVMTVA